MEDISSIDEGKLRYDMFVKAYNDKRDHGGINGLTPSEMFLQTFNRTHNRNNRSKPLFPFIELTVMRYYVVAYSALVFSFFDKDDTFP